MEQAKKIIIFTDSWEPQVNGVVMVLKQLKSHLEHRNFQVKIIEPSLFYSIPLPSYPEISLAIFCKRRWYSFHQQPFLTHFMAATLKSERPDYIHIATEGPIGLAARITCKRLNLKYTTCFHTQMPEYINYRLKFLPVSFLYRFYRRFHSLAHRVLTTSYSMKEHLERYDFKNVVAWYLGVDIDKFKKNPNPQVEARVQNLPRPIFTYLGRIAVEKNLKEFLDLDLPGSKLIVGDGPSKKAFEKQYAKDNVIFTGYKRGQEVVDHLSVSDVFVFPSRTDTFGLAVVEAMACDLPVVAHNAEGVKDLITHGVDGFLTEDLKQGALDCLKLDTSHCRKKAERFSWNNSINTFMSYQIINTYD